MPEISRFLGMKIFMYFNEHNPPHFHVEYNEYKASINIKTFGVMEGIKETGEYHKIDPLV